MGNDVNSAGALSALNPDTRKGAGLVTVAWPRTSYLELAALPTAVPCFRLHSRAVALEWGLTQLAEDIELIVSELVSNSIQAAQRAGELV